MSLLPGWASNALIGKRTYTAMPKKKKKKVATRSVLLLCSGWIRTRDIMTPTTGNIDEGEAVYGGPQLLYVRWQSSSLCIDWMR